MHSLSHCATTPCNADAGHAFAFLADPVRLGSWALGCWNAELVEERVARGTSLFDAAPAYVRVDSDPERLSVDFSVGAEREALVHRISARVLRGAQLGFDAATSIVTLIAWRAADMSDERWARLIASHETEILLLRARIEQAA